MAALCSCGLGLGLGKRAGKVAKVDAAGREGTASRVAQALATMLPTKTATALLARPLSRAKNLTSPWYHAGFVHAARSTFAAIMALSACAMCLVACTETTARGPLAGASDAWAHEPARHSAVAPPPSTSSGAATLELEPDIGRWPLANSAPFSSRGHLPEQQVDVRVNEVALAAYRGLVSDTVFPDGSALAQLSHSRTGPGYAMRKTAGRWRYYQLDAQGRAPSGEPPPRCAACHAQAESDQVFGLPRTLSAPPSGS